MTSSGSKASSIASKQDQQRQASSVNSIDLQSYG
jgi:hypothetical protein